MAGSVYTVIRTIHKSNAIHSYFSSVGLHFFGLFVDASA